MMLWISPANQTILAGYVAADQVCHSKHLTIHKTNSNKEGYVAGVQHCQVPFKTHFHKLF